MSNLLTVVSATVAAYDFRAKYGPAVCSSDLFPSRYLSLNHLEFFRWYDSFMVGFHIILWDFAFTDLGLFCQKVHGEGLLQ